MVSLFYPTGQVPSQSSSTSAYMPQLTADIWNEDLTAFGVPNGTIARLRSRTILNASIASYCHHKTTNDAWPLIILDPGLESSRFEYTLLAESLAQHHYVVALIDHPYNAKVVEFPDGTIVRNPNPTASYPNDRFLEPRVQDITFVLDRLSKVESTHPFRMHTDKVMMWGHSFGGATTGEAMRRDSRIAGGSDFDGAFYSTIIESPTAKIDRPFLLWNAGDFNETEQQAAGQDTFLEIWDHHLIGWKMQLQVRDTKHDSATDEGAIAKAIGFADTPASIENVGTANILRVRRLLRDFLSEFADFVIFGKPGKLLNQNASRYWPEVEVLKFDANGKA
ncbi:MAG: hypothetical protein Q9195_004505 [Heterodermia aff. obscurata]